MSKTIGGLLAGVVIVGGKLKEKFYTDAAAEYVKRLQRYCKLDVVELPEYRLPRVVVLELEGRERQSVDEHHEVDRVVRVDL